MKNISRIILSSASASACTWCILRNEHEILEGIENDIDLFVSCQDYNRFLTSLHTVFTRRGIRCIRERRMPGGISYLLYHPASSEFQKLDVVHENTVAFISIFSSRVIVNNIVPGQAYPVLDPNVAKELSLRKELVRSNPLSYLRHLRTNAPRFSGSRILPQFLLGGYLRAFFGNIYAPSGAFVTLVGPDGSGKTTIAEALAKAAKPNFFSVSLHHFSISTFPRLYVLKMGRGEEPDYTRPNSGTNAPIQSPLRAFVYLVYYGTELILYSHFRLRRRLRLGQLVIFDRYFHDWMFQRSYRNASRHLMRCLLAIAVKPNLVVYLKGDPAMIHARKPELSKEEISTQQILIQEKVMQFWVERGVNTLEVDTTKLPIEEVVESIRATLTTV